MNAIDFIRETAVYLTEERPDVYDLETAVEELSIGIDSLREGDKTVECLMFTSFVLVRVYAEGMEEFVLARKISGMFRAEGEEGVLVYSYSPDLPNLPDILDAYDEDLDGDDED